MGGKESSHPPTHLYIYPCIHKQLVTKWCDALGVANRGIGPVVFYKGFTREFLKGNVGSSADLLRDARESVEQIGRGKKVGLGVYICMCKCMR